MIDFLNSSDPKLDVYILFGFVTIFLLPFFISFISYRISPKSVLSYTEYLAIIFLILFYLFVIALPVDTGIRLYKAGNLNIVSYFFFTLFFWGAVFGGTYLCIRLYRQKHPYRKRKRDKEQ